MVLWLGDLNGLAIAVGDGADAPGSIGGMVSPLDELPQALAAQVQTRSNTVRPTKRECSVNLSLISGPQSRTIGRRMLAPNDARSSTQHQLLHSTNFRAGARDNRIDPGSISEL